jgi:hypothetical protein
VWDRDTFPSDSAAPPAFGHALAFRGEPYLSITSAGRRSWSAPRDIAPQFNNVFTIGNQIVVEPDGTLIDVFNFAKGSGLDQPNASSIGLERSTDGGATWTSRSSLPRTWPRRTSTPTPAFRWPRALNSATPTSP